MSLIREMRRRGCNYTSMYVHEIKNTGVHWIQPVHCYPVGTLCDIVGSKGAFREIKLPRRIIPLGPTCPR